MGNLKTRTAELRTRWACDDKEQYHQFCSVLKAFSILQLQDKEQFLNI